MPKRCFYWDKQEVIVMRKMYVKLVSKLFWNLSAKERLEVVNKKQRIEK